MKKTLLIITLLLPQPVLANEPDPTVTLTARELQAIIASEVARAQAASAIQKVQAAFPPKPPEQKSEVKK